MNRSSECRCLSISRLLAPAQPRRYFGRFHRVCCCGFRRIGLSSACLLELQLPFGRLVGSTPNGVEVDEILQGFGQAACSLGRNCTRVIEHAAVTLHKQRFGFRQLRGGGRLIRFLQLLGLPKQCAAQHALRVKRVPVVRQNGFAYCQTLAAIAFRRGVLCPFQQIEGGGRQMVRERGVIRRRLLTLRGGDLVEHRQGLCGLTSKQADTHEVFHCLERACMPFSERFDLSREPFLAQRNGPGILFGRLQCDNQIIE